MDELHTVKEVLQLLKISRAKLYLLIKDGSIKPVKIGKSTRFYESEINRFLDTLKNADK